MAAGNTTSVPQQSQPACLLAIMQPQSIDKNNQGVELIKSGDFESAIHCFHESLVCFKSELLQHDDFLSSFDAQQGAIPRQQGTTPVHMMNLFRVEHLMMDSTGAYDNEMCYLKAHLSPFRMLHSLSEYFSSLDATHQSSTEKETIYNLSIAVTILNVAISYHHLSLMDSQTCVESIRRSRAKALYHKAIQVIRNSESQHQHIKQLEVMFDLVLIISLNNLLLLLREDDPSTSNESGSSMIQCTQQLLQEIAWCSSKEYLVGQEDIHEVLSKCQEESMMNVLLMRAMEPVSAPAA